MKIFDTSIVRSEIISSIKLENTGHAYALYIETKFYGFFTESLYHELRDAGYEVTLVFPQRVIQCDFMLINHQDVINFGLLLSEIRDFEPLIDNHAFVKISENIRMFFQSPFDFSISDELFTCLMYLCQTNHKALLRSIIPQSNSSLPNWSIHGNDQEIGFINEQDNAHFERLYLQQYGNGSFRLKITASRDHYSLFVIRLMMDHLIGHQSEREKELREVTSYDSSLPNLRAVLVRIHNNCSDMDMQIILDQIISTTRELESEQHSSDSNITLPRALLRKNGILRNSRPHAAEYLMRRRPLTMTPPRTLTSTPTYSTLPYLPSLNVQPRPDPNLNAAILASLNDVPQNTIQSSSTRESGANANAIEHLELTVPEELTCPLSQEIMTCPVYFIGINNKQCFEYSWIMDQLKGSNKHPITREIVRADALVSNWAIKKKCDAFVAKALAPKIEPPAVPVAQTTLVQVTKKKTHRCALM